TAPLIFNNLTRFDGDAENESVSIFVHGVYTLTDALNASLGLRYTNDTKTLSGHNSVNGVCIYPPGTPDVVNDPAAGICDYTPEQDFDFISWSGGFDYRLSSDMFAYVKTARSSRS